MSNAHLAYRPLRGGLYIFAETVDEEGTLGMVLADTASSLWLLTNHHVLSTMTGPNASDSIFQPNTAAVIATVDPTRCNKELDCAAARLTEPAVAEVYGLGKPRQPVAPAVGMRVVKFGAATGLTEGIITKIQYPRIEIGIPNGFEPTYELSSSGDSGSVWLELATRSVVALHIGGSNSGQRIAYATVMAEVLSALSLAVP